jgi:hypothetical protein
MATYTALLARATGQLGLTGQLDAEEIGAVALYEAMRYVAFYVPIPSLSPIVSATAPAPAGDGVITMGLYTTFGLASGTFQAPDRLWVAESSSVVTSLEKGTIYNFMEYQDYLDASSVSLGFRDGINPHPIADMQHRLVWTVKDNTDVLVMPVAQGNEVTLRYRKEVAANTGSNTPEILPLFDFILVNAAVLVLKEWQREPAAITTMWELFSSLKPSIEEYKRHIAGTRRRMDLRVNRNYRVYR